MVWQQNYDKWFLFVCLVKEMTSGVLCLAWRIVTREASFRNVKQMHLVINCACERQVSKRAHGVRSSGHFAVCG